MAAQVAQADQGQRAAEPGAALSRIDADDVDLADGLMPVPAARAASGCGSGGPVPALRSCFSSPPWIFVQWKPTSLPVALGQEEAVRVEPGLALAQVQVLPGPGALLGMAGEGAVVEADPGVLVLATRNVRTVMPSASCGLPMRLCSDLRICHRARERLKPAAAASRAAAGRSPCAHRRSPAPSASAASARPSIRPRPRRLEAGSIDHLPGRPFDRVGRIQVPVAGELAVVPEQRCCGLADRRRSAGAA